MTREEAIIRIEDYVAYLETKSYPTYQIEVALGVAISALREQEERSKGCDWCADIFEYNKKPHAFQKYITPFCPQCGRRLEEV